MHPVASGNKLFKLKYHLEEYRKGDHKGILTFGGAWSNHILATAFVCKEENIPCIGIIRGEKADKISGTLQQALSLGMNVEFIPREMYRNKTGNDLSDAIQHPGYYIIPEGGSGIQGEKGITELHELFGLHRFTHIVCAIGTATMWSGLMKGKKEDQVIIGIPVLKGYTDIINENIQTDFHFGGYAKHTGELFSFMNDFFIKTGIPTDIVYTGKLMYAVDRLATQGKFQNGSQVCVIHSGGLQGNNSLPNGTLIF